MEQLQLSNPFFNVGASMGGEVGANIQKIFSYGHRNSFGMAFNPDDGTLWLQENGDDSFSEINRVLPGMNGGWIQIMGPSERVAQFKEIETTFGAMPNLQQIRWPPANIADTESEALARLFMLPGSHYSDPEFSWKWEVAPGGIGFVEGHGLGGKFRGDLFVGAATPLLEGGYLFRFKPTGGGKKLQGGKGLNDRVADNLAKHDITESEDLLIGRGFGVATDIETGPNGKPFRCFTFTGRDLRNIRKKEVIWPGNAGLPAGLAATCRRASLLPIAATSRRGAGREAGAPRRVNRLHWRVGLLRWSKEERV